MPLPIIITSHPNIFFRSGDFTFLPINSPPTIPKIANAVSFKRKLQLNRKWLASVANPMTQFIVIMSSDVATASFIGKPANKTRLGISKNPPPIPDSPAINPIAIPHKESLTTFFC